MKRKNTIRVNMFGLWAFGLLVGANVAKLIPAQEPSWPPWVLLAIGVLGSIVTSGAVWKVANHSQVGGE